MPWTKNDVEKHKRGLSDAQKTKWVKIANSVRRQCMADGGNEKTCDVYAIRVANSRINNNATQLADEQLIDVYFQSTTMYQTRTETYNGQEHLIVPVVMMVEGVHNGSHGEILHLAEELSKSVGEWNDRPVTLDHPRLNGTYVSAETPHQTVRNSIIGLVRNAHMDGTKLKAEAWLNVQKLTAVSPEVLESINNGEIIEVSTGVFTREEEIEGNYNNEHYIAIARNHAPDHLALLPGGVGACNIADGCGIRVNKRKGGKTSVKIISDELKNLFTDVMVTNKKGMRELVDNLRGLLDSMDTDQQVYLLEEVYDGYVVYRVHNRTTNQTEMYKQPYQLSEDKVELVGNKQKVRRDVEYIEVNEKGEDVMKRTNFSNNKKEENSMKTNEKKGTPCIKERVDKLINNELFNYEEKDREWLENLSEENLDKMLDVEIPEKEKAPEVNNKTSDKKEEVKINKEDAIQVLRESIKSPDDFINLLPDEMRDTMKNGLALHKEKRSKLINRIKTYSENVWSDEELQAKSTDELEKLNKMVKEPSDYSVNGDVEVHNSGEEEEILLPTGITVNESKK